eukprot:gene11235-13106_t
MSLEQRHKWESIGCQLIAEGKVAILLLAGGQATRLGTTFPKGQYAERVHRLQELVEKSNNQKPIPPIPWYIMTSQATHDDTIRFFESHAYFGLAKDSFFFFAQTMIPCLTPDGKIISESASKIDPEEAVGVMSLQNGKPCVWEYSEIDGQSKYLRDESGKLVFNYAHLCINAFSREFLERIAEQHLDSLQYHVANKKIPVADAEGRRTMPEANNGWKMELFIFDVFPFSRNMVALEIERHAEFSPLKNNAGMPVPKDSPETCLRDISALHRAYITRAGGKLDTSVSDLCEVSPLISYAGEGLGSRVSGQTIVLPNHLQ